jgi:hypothetical protein
VSWRNDFSFLRRGCSGDAANTVTAEQRTEFLNWLETMQFEKRLGKELEKTNPVVLSLIRSLLPEK